MPGKHSTLSRFDFLSEFSVDVPQKKLVKTWDEADVTFEDHVQSKVRFFYYSSSFFPVCRHRRPPDPVSSEQVLCATEILAYTAELDGNQIWEIDSSMITEQRWRFLKAVFDISKFDMLALAKLLGSVFGIPIRCNDTFGGKQEYFYVIPEELAKVRFFLRMSAVRCF